ncbi:hypothetical protein [Bacillus sp. V33-4]|uniref:hypothetical protein n=1 Tax=Bacillus sp. V33-4 TaxID=2054169 RepID=UPI00115BF143|nr:hypothetical protein [Bacillus sp. V33-4]
MNKRLNSRQSSPKPLSDKEKAQELLFEAYESTGNKRKQLVEKALKLYPNSPDAYNILAEYEKNPEDRRSFT